MLKNSNQVKIILHQNKWLIVFMAFGAIAFLIGLFVTPTRAWSNFLLSGYFVTGLGFCGIMFVAIHYVSNSGWDVVIRRVPESMFGVLPVGFLMMLLLYFGMHYIYEWSHHDVMVDDPILAGKLPWLNPLGFMIRMVLYFAFWIWIGKIIIKHSYSQDVDGDLRHTTSAKRFSAVWLYIGGILFIASSFDWIMSLEPHWYSTIFGLYNFSGMFTSGLAMIIILLIYLRRKGLLSNTVKKDHLHELARYLFAFVTFWAYIWFSQHMLIWYANLPEETVYYLKRHVGAFGLMTVLNIMLNWLIPFCILLFRKTKRNEISLLIAASLVLIGRWVDLYLMIFPAHLETPIFGLLEIVMFMGTLALFLFVFLMRFSMKDSTPSKDPLLNESIQLHT